jgi:hypothetical protein
VGRETEFGGADYVINDYGKIVNQVKDITQGKMACCSQFIGHRNMG